jgi:tetratricopeptide (TPR) repeat protein
LAYAKTNKRNKMIDSFLESYRKDTSHINSIYQLTNCYVALKDRDSTWLFLDKGLLLAPNHINLNKIKVNELYKEKNYLLATTVLNKIDSLEPKDHFTNSMLGKCHYKLEEFKIAKEKFKIATKIDPENFKSHIYLGHIAMVQKEFRLANYHYISATIVGKEKRDEAYYSLAVLNLENNKRSEAITMFKQALKENRKNYKALYQLALTEDSFYKDKKIALEHYKDFIKKFQEKDEDLANYSKRRISEIKKDFFMKNESLE